MSIATSTSLTIVLDWQIVTLAMALFLWRFRHFRNDGQAIALHP